MDRSIWETQYARTSASRIQNLARATSWTHRQAYPWIAIYTRLSLNHWLLRADACLWVQRKIELWFFSTRAIVHHIDCSFHVIWLFSLHECGLCNSPTFKSLGVLFQCIWPMSLNIALMRTVLCWLSVDDSYSNLWFAFSCYVQIKLQHSMAEDLVLFDTIASCRPQLYRSPRVGQLKFWYVLFS